MQLCTLAVQNSQLKSTLQQAQLSAATSQQKSARLEAAASGFSDQLESAQRRLQATESRLQSADRGLSQRDEQLARFAADLQSSRDESDSKTHEVGKKHRLAFFRTIQYRRLDYIGAQRSRLQLSPTTLSSTTLSKPFVHVCASVTKQDTL